MCYTKYPTLIISYSCNGRCTELNSNEVNEEAAEGDVEKTVRASDEETGERRCFGFLKN